MSIKFKTIQKNNPLNRTAPALWYAHAVGDGETLLQDLAIMLRKLLRFQKPIFWRC